MNYIIQKIKQYYLDNVLTTKDLIYKKKLISAFDIKKSYLDLEKNNRAKKSYFQYGDNHYYYLNDNLLYQDKLINLDNYLFKQIIKLNKGKQDNSKLEKLMHSEIQNSLWIEGIRSSRKRIKQILKNKNTNLHDDIEKYARNYNDALRFVLTTEEINEENVFALYTILSRDIDLKDEKLEDYPYRKEDVEIGESNNLGIHSSEIKKSMNTIFEFVKNQKQINDKDNPKFHFENSLLLHYHFEQIHPYYDINGRMGRLLSIWYGNIFGIGYYMSYISEAINLTKDIFYYPSFKKSQERDFKFDASYFVSSLTCAFIVHKIVYLITKKINEQVKEKYLLKLNTQQKLIVIALLSKEDQFYKTGEFILGADEINPGQLSKMLSELEEWKIIKSTQTKPKEYKLVNFKQYHKEIDKLLKIPK